MSMFGGFSGFSDQDLNELAGELHDLEEAFDTSDLDVEEDTDPEFKTTTCPECGGPCMPLGAVNGEFWWCCRKCGLEHATEEGS